jgi:catechol 2,3-dioxygenase-like lactoylglutathione lyase family enzyme
MGGKVTGLGGVFFKADDPEGLHAWYERHLGLRKENGGVFFRWRERDAEAPGTTVWSIFPRDTTYFDPGKAPFMLNYRVDDMDAILTRLRAEGVTVEDRREDGEYGRFAWVMDPEGNRIELWEPPKGT